MSNFKNFSLLLVVMIISIGEVIVGSGNTDSATIRAIESEIRRVKGTSENIFVEIKKQKDSSALIQGEFKWLHNELKGLKKIMSDIEVLVNKTITDTGFIREAASEIKSFIQTMKNNANNLTSNQSPATTTKKTFKLF